MATRFFLKDVLSISLAQIEIMDIGAMIEGEDRYETLVRQGLGQVTGFEPNSKNLKTSTVLPFVTRGWWPPRPVLPARLPVAA